MLTSDCERSQPTLAGERYCWPQTVFHALPHFPVSQAEPPGLFGHVASWEALIFVIHMSLVTGLWPCHTLCNQNPISLPHSREPSPCFHLGPRAGSVSCYISIVLPALGKTGTASFRTPRIIIQAGKLSHPDTGFLLFRPRFLEKWHKTSGQRPRLPVSQ